MRIYLDQKTKNELSKAIDKIEYELDESYVKLLRHGLETAIVLPVYRSWDEVEFFEPDNESQLDLINKLKHGVIIRGEDDGE